MQNVVVFLCYGVIFLSTVIGLVRFRYLDISMRIVAILLIITSISELCCYLAVTQEKYATRYIIYHFYNIIQAVLITAYFIYAIKPYHYRKFIIAGCILWVLAGAGNILFLQPLVTLNSNMLMLESFSFITMSLYSIYRILKYDLSDNIFRYIHFQMAIIWLVYWSTTLFFWAFVKILYNSHWPYMQLLMYVQTIAELLVYIGIGAVLLYSSKLNRINEQN